MPKPNCSKCGAVKTGSYVKESWCGDCTGAQRKARIARRRAEQGLREWGTGRDPKCKKCRAVKEESYKNGSLCRACKLVSEKERYDKKIREQGLEFRRVGRNPICECGKQKENIDEAQCNKCTNARKSRRYAELKQDPVFMQARRDKVNQKYERDFAHRVKRMCRETTRRRILSGVLIVQPCEVCGTTEAVQAHHDSYLHPEQIRWLCSWHHAEHHKNTDGVMPIDGD